MKTANGRQAADRQQLDDLKAAVDLAELVRASGVELTKKGKNWLGRCPFHADDTASLSVNPQTQLWKCFGCQAAGDALSFLQLTEKIEFPQAVERLRSLAPGLPERVDTIRPPARPGPPVRRSELLARVAELYAQHLPQSPPALAYLSQRGLGSRELIQAFQVGFTDGTVLQAVLPAEGPLRDHLVELGVLTADGKEHFRGCVVVPLTHPEEGVVGLYGRRIRADARNCHLYLPGPQRGVLNWQALKLSPQILVAESVLDALSLWQAGLREVTCLYGVKNVPDDLLALLERFGTREVIFCLDGDEPARQALPKLSFALTSRGVRCQQALLPEGTDPNQLLCERGPEGLREAAERREVTVETAAPERDDQGDSFVLTVGVVTYRVTPRQPFTSRLRAMVRGMREHRLYVDTLDFYQQRMRAQALRQLSLSLELSKLEAQQHLNALLEATENWVAELTQTLAEGEVAAPVLTENDRQEALEFLRRRDLLPQLLADMHELGYVGEENAKLLAYLIGVSRKLDHPLSGVVLSQSGAGKSSLTELVEELTPAEDVVHYSRLSAQSLYYMARDALKQKLLILEERAGAEAADYSIRVLQSKRRLTQAIPFKDPLTGKMTTKTYLVEGPVAYLETTTNPRIHHENATRCFEIVLDESRLQTRRIQEAQRARRLPSRLDRTLVREAVARRHHNAQRLLERVLVFIPYVEHLNFPDRWLRTRRDHERFLCLIEAAAFLHQHQRERGTTEEGTAYLLADLADYALAYRLAKDVLATTLHELSRDAQDLWVALREWHEEPTETPFTRRELRAYTQHEDHRLRQSLQELVDMEYVTVLTGGQGRTFTYRLAVDSDANAPSLLRELLSPEELERRWRGDSREPCEPCETPSAKLQADEIRVFGPSAPTLRPCEKKPK